MKKDFMEIYNGITEKLLCELLSENKDNAVISPLSIIILLTMLADATDGKTRNEILDALGKDVSIEDILNSISEVQKELAETGKLKSASAVCIKNTLDKTIKSEYRDSFRKILNGRLFSGNNMVEEINKWVSDNTDGMIQNIVDESVKEMLACFVNALSFEAKWDQEYKNYVINPGDFHNADGTNNEVSMMRSQESLFIEDQQYIGFTKPYEEGEYSFMALLPKDKDYELLSKDVKNIDFSELFKRRKPEPVLAYIPEYKVSSEKILNDLCKSLGIKKVFSDDADFGSMTSEWLKVEMIKHMSCIQVDRNGTKAAAATASVCYAGVGALYTPRIVELNRPFIFAIVHDPTSLPVFVGCVNHLEGEKICFDDFESEEHHFSTIEERMDYAKKLYRAVCRILHPDYNQQYDTSKEIQKLFAEAEAAYEEYDACKLEYIMHEANKLIIEDA